MQKQFRKMISEDVQLFQVNLDRDKIWEIYLSGFSEETKQSNNCNCCKSFMRQYAGIVSIKDNKMQTLWDFDTCEFPEYAQSVEAVKKYVKSLPIDSIFLAERLKCGTEKTVDSVKNVIWNHFYLEAPSQFVCKIDNHGPRKSDATADANVLKRSLDEISEDAVDTVLELINQGTLYRGNECKTVLETFRKLKINYKKVKGKVLRNNFSWIESASLPSSANRIRNTALGTLLVNLSEDMELDAAVSSFEKIMAPSNYKRPTALVTPKMIDSAKNRLEELGMTESLYRRVLSQKDLTVDNTIFVNRPVKKDVDIFETLKKDSEVNPKTLSKVEEISAKDFFDKVVPTAKSVELLVQNSHLGNFVTLVGPKNDNDIPMFKWANNFSWSYTGAVADSMREKVAALGGRVDGVIRFTHSWNHPELGRNCSLMDLHVFMPGSSKHDDGIHNYYPSGPRVGWNMRNDKPSGGVQDVDYVDAAPENYVPIENISFPSMNKLREGEYVFKIHNWNLRSPTTSGFKAEIELNGQVYQYCYRKPLKNKEWITVAEATLKNGIFTIEHKLESDSASVKKWNIDTEKWHRVDAITLSPNYWNGSVGNKHYLFFLENCVSNEKTRGFYNEFLSEKLSQDRKVFEVLGNKVTVEPVDNELSGLGFSDTLRNEIFVKVTGKFERILKVKF